MATATLNPTPAHQRFSQEAQISSSSQPTTTVSIPRGTVTAELNFFSPPTDGSAPFNYVETPPPNTPQRNYTAAEHAVSISDIRGQEHIFNLDANAFQVLQTTPSAETEFRDDESIKSKYYPEVEKLLLENVPGARKIHLFDHTVRRADPGAKRAPVTRVHIDQTPASALARVSHHLPSEADELLKGRVRIINVWRPLNGPVVSLPLAVADGSSVPEEDLVPVEHRYPDRSGETAGVKYSAAQRWWYLSGMRNEERLLLKCSDNHEVHGKVGRVPHTAFVDPRTEEGWPGRGSIEVRALVFG